MASSSTIIVGAGGIGAGTPFELGSLLQIVQVNPPFASNSLAFERTQVATKVITFGTGDTSASWPLPNTFTERVQIVGGLITDTGATGGVQHDNVIVGRGATAFQGVNARNVVIGTSASSPNNAAAVENVIIGFNNALTQGVGSCVWIGTNISMGVNFPATVIAIGNLISLNNAASGPVIGQACTVQGAGAAYGNQISTSAVNNWVVVGRASQANADGATVLGDNTRGDHANTVTIGRNARSLVANGLVIGGLNVGIRTVLIGDGDTLSGYPGLTYRHTNADPAIANDPAGTVTITASRGVGNSGGVAAGSLLLQTGTIVGAGNALQAAATRLAILPTTALAAAPILSFLGYTDGAAAAALPAIINAPLARQPIAYIPVQTLAGQGWIPVF